MPKEYNISIISTNFFNLSGTNGGGLMINNISVNLFLSTSCFNQCTASGDGGGAYIIAKTVKCFNSVFFNNIANNINAAFIKADNSTTQLLSISKNILKPSAYFTFGSSLTFTCKEANTQYVNSSNNIGNHICSYHSRSGTNYYYNRVQAFNDATISHFVMIQSTTLCHSIYFHSNFVNCTLNGGGYPLHIIRAAEGATMLLEFCYGKDLKSVASYFSGNVKVRNSCFDSYSGEADVGSTEICTKYNNFTFIPFGIYAEDLSIFISNAIEYISDYDNFIKTVIIAMLYY